MSKRIRRGAALVAAAAMLGLIPGHASAAPATSPRPGGTLLNWAYGIPHTVHRGQTITLSLWYKLQGPERVMIVDYGVTMWNVAAPGEQQLRGITSSFLDPATGRWQKETNTQGSGIIDYALPTNSGARIVTVSADQVEHVYIKFTFGKTAHLGTWHIEPYVGTLAMPNNEYQFPTRINHTYTFTLKP